MAKIYLVGVNLPALQLLKTVVFTYFCCITVLIYLEIALRKSVDRKKFSLSGVFYVLLLKIYFLLCKLVKVKVCFLYLLFIFKFTLGMFKVV